MTAAKMSSDNLISLNWKKPPENRRTHLHQRGETVWLTFDALSNEKWLRHAFSTRLSGVSQNELSSMNFSFDRDTSRENVLKNFRIFCDAADFPMERLVLSDQTHTTNLHLCTAADAGTGLYGPMFQDMDGLLTDTPDLTLVTFYADCVPIFFADPVHHAVALSHSGWRGTVQNMAGVTVERMKKEFGTRPEDLICVIGPSICADCYEVGEEFSDSEHFGQKGFPERVLQRREDGRLHLDLWAANRHLLEQAGVPSERIQVPDICTCCNPDFLFSHRASGGRRGLLGAFLGITLE